MCYINLIQFSLLYNILSRGLTTMMRNLVLVPVTLLSLGDLARADASQAGKGLFPHKGQ